MSVHSLLHNKLGKIVVKLGKDAPTSGESFSSICVEMHGFLEVSDTCVNWSTIYMRIMLFVLLRKCEYYMCIYLTYCLLGECSCEGHGLEFGA